LSADSHRGTDDRRRLTRVRSVVAVGCIAGLATSHQLWMSDRGFPLIPVGEAIGPFPSPWDGVVFLGLIGALVAVALRRRPRLASAAVVVLAVVLVLQDQMRLRAWFYQYVLMLAMMLAGPGRAPSERTALRCLRLMMGATYLWSGLHKLNPAFVDTGFPWIVGPWLERLPAWAAAWLGRGGLVAGPVEALIGLALLTRSARRLGVAAGVAMHVFILAALGPLGHGWNHNVWPWNLTMIALLVVLFPGERDTLRQSTTSPGAMPKLALVLFLVMPATNALDVWDSYTSFALYSYTAKSAAFVVKPGALDDLPASARAMVHRDESGRNELMADAWSVAELGVPTYPETRVFRRIHDVLCAATDGGPDAVLRFQYHRRRRDGDQVLELYRCGEAEPFRREVVAVDGAMRPSAGGGAADDDR